MFLSMTVEVKPFLYANELVLMPAVTKMFPFSKCSYILTR
jgi:hypothetical protein